MLEEWSVDNSAHVSKLQVRTAGSSEDNRAASRTAARALFNQLTPLEQWAVLEDVAPEVLVKPFELLSRLHFFLR